MQRHQRRHPKPKSPEVAFWVDPQRADFIHDHQHNLDDLGDDVDVNNKGDNLRVADFSYPQTNSSSCDASISINQHDDDHDKPTSIIKSTPSGPLKTGDETRGIVKPVVVDVEFNRRSSIKFERVPLISQLGAIRLEAHAVDRYRPSWKPPLGRLVVVVDRVKMLLFYCLLLLALSCPAPTSAWWTTTPAPGDLALHLERDQLVGPVTSQNIYRYYNKLLEQQQQQQQQNKLFVVNESKDHRHHHHRLHQLSPPTDHQQQQQQEVVDTKNDNQERSFVGQPRFTTRRIITGRMAISDNDKLMSGSAHIAALAKRSTSQEADPESAIESDQASGDFEPSQPHSNESTTMTTMTSTMITTTTPNNSERSHEKMNRLVDELKQKYIYNRNISNRAYYLVLFVYTIFSIFGALANSIICLTVILKPKILSPRNIFILNLASSDLLLCIFTMPFSFIEISSKTWPMGELPCKLVSSLQATSIFVSTISITAIALDRYRVIVYSTHQDSSGRMNGLTGAVILLSVWCAALILSLPLFMTRQLKTVYLPEALYEVLGLPKSQEFYFCIEEWPFVHGRGIYSVVSMFIQYVVPITIVSIVYVKISDKLQKRLKRRQRLTQLENQHKRQLQLINRTHNMLITVSLVFGLCWLPLNLLNVIVDFTDFLTKDENMFRTVFAICHLIGCFSACSNPILYGYMNENFRKEIILVYTQQWQKITRYMCQFRAHSRSTRRTVATTTTTTTDQTSSSTSSPSAGSACSTSRSSITSSSSSSSAASGSASGSRSGSSCSGSPTSTTSSHSKRNSRSIYQFANNQQQHQHQRILPFKATNHQPQFVSHTAIDMRCNDDDHLLANRSETTMMLSNSCNLVQKPKNNSLTNDHPLPRHHHRHSNQHLSSTNHHHRGSGGGGGWLERVLVRSVWFMGSMSSYGDKTSRDDREPTSTTCGGYENHQPPANQQGIIKTSNNLAKNPQDNCIIDEANNIEMNRQGGSASHRVKSAKSTHRKTKTTITVSSSISKKKNKREDKRESSDKQTKKPKTKCVCHCHKNIININGDTDALKANNKSNNNAEPGDAILRTCSTGTRPQNANVVSAEVRLAKANALKHEHCNHAKEPDEFGYATVAGGSIDELNKNRRRSSTDARANNKLKTISSSATSKQQSRLHHDDSLDQPMGQRVWLRFFPSMQRYCFNQAAINSLPQSATAESNKPRGKIARHCSICRPSAERRRKERREQRQLRRLARKEAKSAITVSSKPVESDKFNECSVKQAKTRANNVECKQAKHLTDQHRPILKDNQHHHQESIMEEMEPMQHAIASRSNVSESDRNITSHEYCRHSDTLMSCQSDHSGDDPKKIAVCTNQIPCSLANCSGPNICTIDSVNEESNCTRKESLASYGSKSCGAISLSSSYSCNHSSLSYSTCSCLAHSSSLHYNGSLACIESISSVTDRIQTEHEQDAKM